MGIHTVKREGRTCRFTAYHHFRGSAFLPSSKKAKGFRHVPEKAFPDRTSPLTDAPKTGLLVLRMGESFYTRTTEAPSSAFDLSLRPPAFSEFCGQEKIKDRLMLMVEAARQRDDVLDHILLSGPPGLGKTTLANIIANAVGCRIHTTSGPQIEKAGDLAGVLTNLEKGDILFIDEIHRLHPAIEEYLYPAMEDFRLDIIIDQGPNARSIQLNLPKFTLVGATTRAGMLTSPLRSRFGLVNRLDYYTREELCAIIERSAGLLNVPVDPEGALQIALRSRGTPRVANSLLRWVRDYAQVRGDGVITEQLAHDALTMIEIDDDGLDEMDKRLLEAMIYKFNGGPVGLSSLAVAVGEDASTLEDVHEPFLIMQGYISRTPRGRVAMPSAYLKMGAAPPANGQGWLL
jgi:Holliday junction DNA helicase RuvB